MLDGRPPLGWFAPATERVLGAEEELAAANSPRELEAVVGRLLGRELHKAMRGEDPRTKNREWFAAMLESALEQVHSAATEDGRQSASWLAGLRLLHGMVALAPRERRVPGSTVMARAMSGVVPANTIGT